MASQHLEDHVLGAHPVGELRRPAGRPRSRHREMERLARDGHARLRARPRRSRACPATRRRTCGCRIRAASCPGRRSAACGRVTDAVAGLAVPEPEAAARHSGGTRGRRRCGSRPAAGCGRRTAPKAPSATRSRPIASSSSMTIVPVASWVSVWSMRTPISAPGVHLALDEVRRDQLLRDVSTHAQCILADPAAEGTGRRFSRDVTEGTKGVSYEPG